MVLREAIDRLREIVGGELGGLPVRSVRPNFGEGAVTLGA